MSLDEMAAKAFGVTSFTTVGHLLHINLKDHLLQHKYDIGAALLQKCPRALAVVNKLNTIDNTFRNFDVEVIAKREDCDKTDEELMIVQVNENKCRFQFDFSKVYWNSRLCTEHERIIAKLNKCNDVVFDLFAGVGPFAVPAAKSKCRTYANDLNPESYKWLEINMQRNKAPLDHYKIFNMDAKEFIQTKFKPFLRTEYERVEEDDPATKPKIHILMNLPALAPTFLPLFVGLFKETEKDATTATVAELFKKQELEHVIYCYCFLKGLYDNPKGEVKSMIEEQLGRSLSQDQLIDIFRVRNVAPYKDMYRVEIRLDEHILFGHKDVVSIMRNSSQGKVLTNGAAKKVTIQVPSSSSQQGKRAHDNLDSSSDSSDYGESSPKKSKSDYCSVM